MSSPLSIILPSLGNSKPAIIRSVVVFPHPEGPKMVMNSPGLTSKLKSSTTVVPSKIFLTCDRLMMAEFCSITLPPEPRVD